METKASSQLAGAAPKLLDQVRGKIRLKHYSIRTEQSYTDWIKRFIRHFGKRHPRDLGATEVEAFLTHLAVDGKVAASTQNQAKSALLFLYREVLEMELPWLDNIEQAKAPKRLPVVLTVTEVQSLLSRLEGTHQLVANLLYGTGCASWKHCVCELRISIFSVMKSLCEMARASRIASLCCR